MRITCHQHIKPNNGHRRYINPIPRKCWRCNGTGTMLWMDWSVGINKPMPCTVCKK